MPSRFSLLGVTAIVVLLGACAHPAPPSARPNLPAGPAGDVLGRAIDAAGGWDRWQALKDVAFVTTLTILDPVRNIESESIGWYMAPLHQGLRARMDSIGMPEEVRFGIDGKDVWILRDGEQVSDPPRLELTRFSMATNLFWFSLPFLLAERPVTVTDLGERGGDDERRCHRVKFVFDQPDPILPGDWIVVCFDTETGLIERVYAQLRADFLRHELWVGKWLDYRDWNGLKKERRRQFFPADADGDIIGGVVADQLVEHVRFNTGFAPDFFARPKQVKVGEQARRRASATDG